MDNKDIAIIVLAILNVVTIAVLIYLMATRNRTTAGGQLGHGLLPLHLQRSNAEYYNEHMHKLNMRHQKEQREIQDRTTRRINGTQTLWDIMSDPFTEDIDAAAMRQGREQNELMQKFRF